MSRLILTRLAWVAVGLVAIVTAAFAIQPIMSGPEPRHLGPVAFNTHAPVPTETETPEPEPSPTSAEPTDTETAAPESQPVVPAPPVVVEDYDDEWDDDGWDDDDAGDGGDDEWAADGATEEDRDGE